MEIVDILRDSLWQFIGALVGTIALVVTVVIFFRSTNRKSLSVEKISNTLLLAVDMAKAQRLQILFDGHQVSEPRLVILRFVNDGNAPVESRDFEMPIAVSFDKSCVVLEANVIDRVPDSIKPVIEVVDQSKLAVFPLLLNPDDSFTIQALVAGSRRIEIKVDSRISGVKEITDLHQSHARRRAQRLLVSSLFLIPIVIGMILLIRSQPPGGTWSLFLLTAGTMSGILGLIGLIVYGLRKFFQNL